MDSAINRGQLMDRAQLSGALDVSESTVRRWEAAGLPHTPIGRRGRRYNPQEVMDWLRRRFGQPDAART